MSPKIKSTMALEGEETPTEAQKMMTEVRDILAHPGGGNSERIACIFQMQDNPDPTLLNDLSSIIARHHTGEHPEATAYIVSRLRGQMADILRDPNKLKEDIDRYQSLQKQMRLQHKEALKTWTLPKDNPHYETLKAIMDANAFTASPEGLESFIRGLSKEKMATIDRMKEDPNSIQKLVPVLDMPYLDYYETAEDAKSGDTLKMKPGLITLANEIFTSKRIRGMWIDAKYNQSLKEYLQAEDDKRIKPRHANGEKVTVDLKWSIQEGADDPAAAKYADGESDNVDANFEDRFKKAREQGVETTYMTHIPSQLLRAQNDKLITRNEACQTTFMVRDQLKDGRVGFVLWNGRSRVLQASLFNALYPDASARVRTLVM